MSTKSKIVEILIDSKVEDIEGTVDFLIKEGVISYAGLRDYIIAHEVDRRVKESGRAPKSIMLDMEVEGKDGVAEGVSLSTIHRAYKRHF